MKFSIKNDLNDSNIVKTQAYLNGHMFVLSTPSQRFDSPTQNIVKK